ncbi:MAG: MMPL family transporter [Zoogloeaceae bacterium]|jgi:predicted exporter|nr:MMPL family transporter [Zoogloeaceae bacterium]
MNYARRHRLLACLWLALLLFAALFLLLERTAWSARVDTDLFALLPKDERHPALEAALKALSVQGERQLALLVSTPDEASARQAAQTLRVALRDSSLVEQGDVAADVASFPGDFYFPYRQGLMSAADRAWLLLATPEEAQNRALTLANAPFAPSGIPWLADPFGFFGAWLQSLGEATPLRPSGGELMLEHDGRVYAALLYTLPGSAFDSEVQEALTARLDAARQTLRQAFPQARLLRAGIVLHAAAATAQAQGEMRLIGLGSLLATFLLISLVFQSARALKLIVASLISGTLIALIAAFALFERVHLITLVFGASLIGVAVDYAILVFAQHLGNTEPVWERFRRLLPTLCMVLLTPALAYLALALTPFPGLKQMAVFAVSGIFGAWMSVVCFYPYLLPPTLPLPENAHWMTGLLDHWPRWQNSGKAWGIALVLAALTLGGLLRLQANDDIRSLFSGDPALMAEQGEVSSILQLPSPAQMFLLTADSAERLLQKEEALIERLRPLIGSGKISGFEATSRWLPSEARQQENRARQKKLRVSRKALAREMELPADWAEEADAPPLTPEIGLRSPFRQAAQAFWLGETQSGKYASMVLLKGLQGKETAAELAQFAAEGVSWIDQTRDISDLMQRYRHLLTQTLLAACLLLPVLLYPFFRREVWRLLAPVLLAGLMTLAIMGYLNIPAQMLSILALLLTLGMGVDYAIFLAARQTHAHTLLATTLAAALTLASFGLLAFSATPALHALGLTATLGVTLSWLLTPVFRSPCGQRCAPDGAGAFPN